MNRTLRALLDVVWLAVTAVVIVAWPLFVYHEPLPRRFFEEHRWAVVAPAVCYIAAVLLAKRLVDGAWRRIWVGLYAATFLLCAYATVLLLAGFAWPRAMWLATGGGVLFFTLLSIALPTLAQSAVLVAAVASIAVLYRLATTPVRPARRIEDRTLHTRYGSVNVRFFHNYLPHGPTTGGGFASVDGRLFVATGDGQISELTFVGDGNEVSAVRLPFVVPLNTDLFAAQARQSRSVNTFRTTAIHVTRHASRLRFFAMHHVWHDSERCFAMRVSTLERSADDLSRPAGEKWRTIYETKPCLPLTKPTNRGFKIYESGGRMLMLDDDHLLVTVGDHEFDGVNSKPGQAQDPSSDYGKTLLIQISSGTRQLFSSGHRNPQGLHQDAHGRLWAAEQGPDGGDEINELQREGNYGWPIVTYGTDYGEPAWPLNPAAGEHLNFIAPLFSWLPSIGVSNLIAVRGDNFRWRDDLVAASLRDRSLHRLRVRERRVTFDERILIGLRIRDIHQVADDRIVLVTDDRVLASLRPLTVGEQERVAFSACAGCHPVVDGRTHGIGPDLFGVYRREAAKAADFKYSDALRAKRVRWNRDWLDRFLQDPSGSVPGTSMDFDGIADQAERNRIINYLMQTR